MAQMKNKKVPLRQCVGCRQMKDKRQMLRVIRTADGEITTDATGKKNGRGAYICFSGECLDRARKNRGLERSLHTDISAGIYEAIEKELSEFDAK